MCILADSSVSLDSPRVRSDPADMFAFVSQQNDEQLIQVLGKSWFHVSTLFPLDHLYALR